MGQFDHLTNLKYLKVKVFMHINDHFMFIYIYGGHSLITSFHHIWFQTRNVIFNLSEFISQSGFSIIKINLVRLMLGSEVWTVERPRMWTFKIFEPLKAHTCLPNISLIRLMLIMQNPECSQKYILISIQKWWAISILVVPMLLVQFNE